MNPIEAAFLSLLCSGILTLLAGLMLTRLHWRQDIAPYGRRARFFHVTLHPEHYVKEAPLRAIKSLTLAGGVLLAGATAVAAYEILRTTLSP